GEQERRLPAHRDAGRAARVAAAAAGRTRRSRARVPGGARAHPRRPGRLARLPGEARAALGGSLMDLERIVAVAQGLYDDLELGSVRAWKAADAGRRAVGYLPTYVPREVLHAAGVLPVGIQGADERLEIVRGDACFQSYICHLPRSVMELGLS